MCILLPHVNLEQAGLSQARWAVPRYCSNIQTCTSREKKVRTRALKKPIWRSSSLEVLFLTGACLTCFTILWCLHTMVPKNILHKASSCTASLSVVSGVNCKAAQAHGEAIAASSKHKATCMRIHLLTSQGTSQVLGTSARTHCKHVAERQAIASLSWM